MSKKSGFREPFDKQHGRPVQALFKSASHHPDQIHWSLISRLSWKKSLLLTCKISLLFLNTLAGNEKYAVLNRDNLPIPIQVKLSQRQKRFPQSLPAFSFLKSGLNFEYFEKKYHPHRFCISETTDSENAVIEMSEKFRWRRHFKK